MFALGGTLTLAVSIRAQTADSFNPGANNVVDAMAVQADGKVLVGGSFTTLGGQTRSYFGRLNTDGSLDTAFNPAANGSAVSLAVQADGKILAAGNFTTLGGHTCTYLGRLNADGSPDANFNPVLGPANNGQVYSLAVQVDGKILVGGHFTFLDGQPRNYIGRLNVDGTLDTVFNPGSSFYVFSLTVQGDGRVLVGGYFTSLVGQTRNYIGRLNADGSLDTTFNPNSGGTVYSLAIQADGRILVGGSFSTLGGQTRHNIGRLNADGTLNTVFNPVANGSVYSLVTQADGKILVGGNFTTLGGQIRTCLGRLNADGSLDTAFNPGSNGNLVNALAVQADGNILVGGLFTSLAGQSRTNIGRLYNTDFPVENLAFDGSTIIWLRGGTAPEFWRTSFDGATNGAADWFSLGAGVRVSGGWQLSSVNLPTNTVIRARGYAMGGSDNASGWFVEEIIGPPAVTSSPASLTNNPGTSATFAAAALGAAPLSYHWLKNGVLLDDTGNISGAHTAVLSMTNVLGADAGAYAVLVANLSGSVTSQIATLTVLEPSMASHPIDQVVNPGQSAGFSTTVLGTPPLAYQWFKDGSAVAEATASSLAVTNSQLSDVGNYWVVVTNVFGSVTSSVVTLAVNLANVDPVFNPGVGFLPQVLAVQANGSILVGGLFSTLGGQTRQAIGRLNADGTLDTVFNPGAPASLVASLVVQADGKILVGGGFQTLAGQARTNIGRLNADGSLDAAFNSGANISVNALAVQADGRIIVGGPFSTLGGQPLRCIGRLNADGGLDTSFNPGANNPVDALAVEPDGSILAGGGFTNLAGQTRVRLGRLNADGSLDTTFNSGASAGYVGSFAVQADGKILVGGTFTNILGQTRNSIGRLNTDGSLDMNFNPGLNGDVRSIAVQADGRILVAGSFTTLSGHTCNHIGRINADGSVDTTFNPAPNSTVNAIALQADGSVVLAGWFTALGGHARSYIGRVNNTDAATQDLAFAGTTLTWLRGGTSPEVWRTTFECSTNGADWFNLGSGVRISGGWQLSDVALPANASIRALGCITGSGGLVEALMIASNSPPQIVVNDGQFGFVSNRFGFDLAGPAGQTAIVEVSSDLLVWLPLQTNLLGILPQYFSEPSTNATPRRFYRIRIP
jgi:uncharacterized delta-60 repeat protein